MAAGLLSSDFSVNKYIYISPHPEKVLADQSSLVISRKCLSDETTQSSSVLVLQGWTFIRRLQTTYLGLSLPLVIDRA